MEAGAPHQFQVLMRGLGTIKGARPRPTRHVGDPKKATLKPLGTDGSWAKNGLWGHPRGEGL